jgi:hypothetical protein
VLAKPPAGPASSTSLPHSRGCTVAVWQSAGAPSMTAEEEPQAPPAEENDADAEPKTEKKPFVKRTQRPDQAELRAKVESLEATITAQKQRVESIRSELDGRNRRRANDTESQGIRNQLQELRTQFQQVLVRPSYASLSSPLSLLPFSIMPTRVGHGSRLRIPPLAALLGAVAVAFVLDTRLISGGHAAYASRANEHAVAYHRLQHTSMLLDQVLLLTVVLGLRARHLRHAS